MPRCDFCQREFGNTSALNQHMVDRHSQPAAKRDLWKPNNRGARNNRLRHRGRGPAVVIILVSIVLLLGIAYALISLGSGSPHNTSSATGIESGETAPDFRITLLNGSSTSLSSFRGHTVLLWFVTTWCSSCQLGAQELASSYYSALSSKGITILTVELYNDLGQPGPSLGQFAMQYGNGPSSRGWSYGNATQSVAYTYDPRAYLDVYYVIGANGTIQRTGVGLPNDLASIASSY